MTIGRLIGSVRGVGLGPALLVLLLSVRVATAAAVECHHELADAAHAHAHIQETLKLEAAELGGELCLIEDHPALTPETAQDHDGPHLNTPCPFFKSPVALADVTIEPTAQNLSFSRVVRVYDDRRAEAGALPVGYNPRAPPVVALG